MEMITTPPGATRLIESLRNLGYDLHTAIADIIDNSLAAQATEIYVEIRPQQGTHQPYISIADNGWGMNRAEMVEAMRFGAYQEYGAQDLGKFGLGLKTASLSQCRRLTVISKPVKDGGRSHRNVLRWDLDHVYKKDGWELLALELGELKDWEREVLNHSVTAAHGTVVLWTDLKEVHPLFYSDDKRARERFLEDTEAEVGDHLRMVFHRFMQGVVPKRKKVSIFVNGERLQPWDPFCLTEKTKKLGALSLDVGIDPDGKRDASETVVIAPYILPREDEFSSPAAFQEASGPRKWNFQQGFYFYRNNRMLQSGGWSNLRAPDEHTKLLRVAVDFPSDLDVAFTLNITKMRAKIPSEIRDKVKTSVTEWIKLAKERYGRAPARVAGASIKELPRAKTDEKPHNPAALNVGAVTLNMSNVPNGDVAVAKGNKDGQVRLVVPQKHQMASVFNESLGAASDLKRLAMTMLLLLEAVYDEKLFAEQIPIDSLKRSLKKLL